MKAFRTASLVLTASFLAMFAQAQSGGSSTSVSITGSEAEGYTAYAGASSGAACYASGDWGYPNTDVTFAGMEDNEVGFSAEVETTPYYLGPGSYEAYASFTGYMGDDGDGDPCTVGGSGASASLTVPAAASAVSSANGVVTSGHVLTLTPYVGPSQPFTVFPTPTGSVSLLFGAQTLATATLNSSAQATLSLSTTGIQPGTYNVQLAYGGDSNYYPSTTPITVKVNTAPPPKTTTVLSVSPTELLVGQQVSLDAQVSWTSPDAPTGTVTFKVGTITLGTASVEASGKAVLTSSSKGVPAGTYSVVATYSGDSNNLASESAPVSVTVVAQSATTTTLTVQPAITVQGQSVVLAVSVAQALGSAPAGTVTLLSDGEKLATLTLQNGAASLTVSSTGLAAGNYSLTAQYNGSSTDLASTSTAQSLQVLAATATSIAVSPNPVSQGNTTVLSSSVKETEGSAVPTGTVTFAYQGNSLGVSTLSDSAAATLSVITSGLPKGSDAITATYSGDGSNGSSAGTVNLTVQ